MSSRKSVITALDTLAPRRPRMVVIRWWVRGRGGVRWASGSAMPTASAGPMPIANVRPSRLPRSTITGEPVSGLVITASTATSWGDGVVGAWARPLDATSIAQLPSSTASAAFRFDRLMRALRARQRAKRLRSIRPAREQVNRAVGRARWERARGAFRTSGTGREAEAHHDAAEHEDGEHRPHRRVAETVGDVAEDESAHRVADEGDRAEDAHRAGPPRLGGDVHEQRGERGVEKAVRAAGDEAGEENERQDREAH